MQKQKEKQKDFNPSLLRFQTFYPFFKVFGTLKGFIEKTIKTNNKNNNNAIKNKVVAIVLSNTRPFSQESKNRFSPPSLPSLEFSCFLLKRWEEGDSLNPKKV